MGFQGNVAGTGLAEVLQSIARGETDGVLHLDAGEVQARLGMRQGMAFPLPAKDEQEDTWRFRCQLAWAEDPQPSLEGTRRSSIARAARIETLYRLIDSKQVHFQFAPGQLDAWVASGAQAGGENPWGPGIPVEYLLLEHARLSDEANDGLARTLDAYDVPHRVGGDVEEGSLQKFLLHCDGLSTVGEIADRMGWTQTQARGTIGKLLTSEHLHLRSARDLLLLAQREMELGRFERAASRLTGWLRSSSAGPLAADERELFDQMWSRGHLGSTITEMYLVDARGILRRLDVGEEDMSRAQARWETLSEAHRGDASVLIRTYLWRLRAGVTFETQGWNELLRLARGLQERGFETRARTVLRLVSTQIPEKLSTRMELGTRLLDAGLVEEGSHWLVESARDLLQAREVDRAAVPLRTVLRADPNHREAHGLLLETHAQSARRRRRKYTSVVALSIVLLLSSVALVHLHREQKFGEKIDEIASLSARPSEALALLDSYFPNDPSERIVNLRQGILRRLREEAEGVRERWLERYDEIEQECTFGDALMGLNRALQLPPPPEFEDLNLGPWPTRADLLNVLADQVESEAAELRLPLDATLEDIHYEEIFLGELGEMLAMAAADERSHETESFQLRIREIRDDLVHRRELRAEERVRIAEREEDREQDILLASARSHANAGDFERSLAAYERLLHPTDPADAQVLQDLFGAEAAAVRAHYEAYQTALQLCEEGRHEEARIVLEPHAPNLAQHLMPWRVTTLPPGARVATRRGGTRTTPFVMRSAFGEPVQLRVELAGFEPRTITVDDPADLVIELHAEAEQTWTLGHRIEAAPVATGREHIVADRAGHIARIDEDGVVQWERELKSLGGIARTPIFLPSRPGHLLFVTEDGEAWVVEAETGSIEGPWVAGSPPEDGPIPTRSGVSALFANGRVAVWETGVEPELFDAETTFSRSAAISRGPGSDGALEILRRGPLSDTRLDCHWSDWVVEVRDEHYRIHRGDPTEAFTVSIEGQWIFVGWEAPNALIPDGRLWISDDAGLRSLAPSLERLHPGYDE